MLNPFRRTKHAGTRGEVVCPVCGYWLPRKKTKYRKTRVRVECPVCQHEREGPILVNTTYFQKAQVTDPLALLDPCLPTNDPAWLKCLICGCLVPSMGVPGYVEVSVEILTDQGWKKGRTMINKNFVCPNHAPEEYQSSKPTLQEIMELKRKIDLW